MSKILDSIPPHNIQAETSVLSAGFTSKNCLDEMLSKLNEKSFYITHHAKIFKALSNLNSENVQIDIITLCEKLKENNDLEDVGGYSYVLTATESIVHGMFTKHLEILKNLEVKRDLITFSYELIEMAFDPTTKTDDLLEVAESGLYAISQDKYTNDLEHMKQTFEEKELEYMGYIDNRGITEEQKSKKINTGFEHVDTLLEIQPGGLYILAARPAIGKSSYAVNLATYIALNQNLATPIFSLEMLKGKIADRIITSEFGKSYNDFKYGNVSSTEKDKLKEIFIKLKKAPIFIDDKGAVSPQDIKNKLRKLKTKGQKIGVVVVDYLQLLKGKGFNRENEVSQIARELKNIALELEVPIIALSQLSRAVEQRQSKKPIMSDLIHSSEIEAAADAIIMLYREEYYNPGTRTKTADVIIVKNREGSTGEIELFFDGSLTKFASLEKY